MNVENRTFYCLKTLPTGVSDRCLHQASGLFLVKI